MTNKDKDVTSDPAESADPGQDWTSEGGADPEGPATDVDNDDPGADEG